MAQDIAVHEASGRASCAARFARLSAVASWSARRLVASIACRTDWADVATKLSSTCGVLGIEEIPLSARRCTCFDETHSNAYTACGTCLARRLPGFILIGADATERWRRGAGRAARAPWARKAIVDGGAVCGRTKSASWTDGRANTRSGTECAKWAWL